MKKLSFKNQSLILSGITTIGIIATGISVAKATQQATVSLEKLERLYGEEVESIPTFEKLKTIAPCYSWSALIMAGTICSVWGNYQNSVKVNSALVSAYSMIDKAYSEYRNKNIELNGEKNDTEIMAAVAFGREDDIIMFEGDELFYDEYSGRFFKSTTPEVTNAFQTANELFIEDGFLELNELYSLLGIDDVEYGNYVGWGLYHEHHERGCNWIKFKLTEAVTGNGMGVKYNSISYVTTPTASYLY